MPTTITTTTTITTRKPTRKTDMTEGYARDVKALSFFRLCEALKENKKTLIICHARPDGDAIGSAFALKAILGKLGIESYCVCEDEVPKRLRFLSAPIQSGSLADSIPEDFYPERVITVDTASPSQLGKLAPYFSDKVDIMIDHHRSGFAFADNYIDSNAAATGEIIYKIADALLMANGIPLPRDAARCLYAAISSDTGCFKYSNVTPTTHMVAASLVKSGIDAAEINRLLFDAKSPERLKAEKVALQRLKLFDGGRISCVALSYEDAEAEGVDLEELDALIDVARCVDGVMVAFAVKQKEAGETFRISMRSECKVDVAAICERFGGGGHVKAAGCAVTAGSADEAAEIILREIEGAL